MSDETDDRIERAGRWTITPELLTLDPRISHRAFRLWCRLDRFAGNGSGGGAFPSRDTLCVELDSSWSGVDRAIKELVAAGWLSKRRREAGGRNVYTLHDALGAEAEAALNDLIEADREAKRAVLMEKKRAIRSKSPKEGSEDANAQVSEGGVVTGDDRGVVTSDDRGVVTGDDRVSSLVTTHKRKHQGMTQKVKETTPPLRDVADGSVAPGDNLTPGAPAASVTSIGPRSEAERITRQWHDAYTANVGPIVNWRHVAVRNMVEGALKAGYSEAHIKHALKTCGQPVPTIGQFQSNLAAIASGRPAQGRVTSTRAVADNSGRERGW